MRARVVLGLRLAGLGSPRGAGRFGGLRTAMVTVSATVGTSLLLGVAAISRSELAMKPEQFDTPGMKVLLASVVAVIALPVLVLAATAGRLSASLRDRRLANLRLLGLSPSSTRVVSAVETGVAAVLGSVLGLLAFLAVRPGLLAWHPAGREWTAGTLRPSIGDYILALILVPLAVVGISSMPQRLSGHDSMATARKTAQHRPPFWRLAPLLIGAILASYVIATATDTAPSYDQLAAFMFSGMILLGIGMILAVPIFVRLVADGLVRCTDRPTLMIAGRRLQAQPAATSRVVAGLLIGLFIVTGARALVVAFEDTEQYQAEARIQNTGQLGSLQVRAADAPEVAQRARQTDGVRATATVARLRTGSCAHGSSNCLQALVGTCSELRLIMPLKGPCREDRAQWLIEPDDVPFTKPLPPQLKWHILPEGPQVFIVAVPTPEQKLHVTGASPMSGDQVFLPENLIDSEPASRITDVEVVVAAEPGREVTGIMVQLAGSGAVQSWTGPGTYYYDFVSGLRTLVWAIAAVILSVGLLSFAIAAIDRGIARREEVMSLLLAGVSARTLRRTQWIETSLPLAAGTVLAIGLGLLAGASYLAFGRILEQLPWRQTMTLAGISAASAALVAALTVVASNPRIRPELIRSE